MLCNVSLIMEFEISKRACRGWLPLCFGTSLRNDIGMISGIIIPNTCLWKLLAIRSLPNSRALSFTALNSLLFLLYRSLSLSLALPFLSPPFFSISSPPRSVIHSELSNSIMLLPLFSKSDLVLAALISALLLLRVAYEAWRKAYWDWFDPIHGHIQSDAPGCAFPSPPPFGRPCPRLLT